MKKAIKLLLVIAMVISLSSFAYSAPGFYAGGNVGIALLDDSNVSVPGFSSYAYVDNGFSVSGFIGYSFKSNFRTEAELVYQGNDTDSLDYYSPNGIERYDLTGDISSTSLFINGYYDFRNSSSFTPFIGAGVGFSNVELSDVNFFGGFSDLNDDDFVLAYHLDAGISYEINERFTVDLKYRYFETEDPEFDSYFGTGEIEYSSHNIYTGLRVSF
jgi:opacity protein-like surface antigen